MAKEPTITDRVLVADDDPERLSATSRTLKKAGYEVVEADTGARCLEMARSLTPKLILLGTRLPDAEGIAVCKSIKGETSGAAPLVALLSDAGADPYETVSGLEAGADAYIIRPVSNRELLARLEALLRIRRSEEQVIEDRNRLASILQYCHDAIIGVDPGGRVFAWNPGAEGLFGHSRDTARGKSVYTLLSLERPEKLEDALAKIQQEEQAVYLSSAALKKSSPATYISMTISPIKGAGETLIGASLIARDVTQEVRQCDACNRELRSMRGLSAPARASVTAGTFGLSSLHKARPSLFARLVHDYEEAIAHSWENRVYRVNHPVSEALRGIADYLGRAGAGPRDVVQIHVAAIKNKANSAPADKQQAYAEAGRLLLIELMGYLTSYYRNHLLGIPRAEQGGSPGKENGHG